MRSGKKGRKNYMIKPDMEERKKEAVSQSDKVLDIKGKCLKCVVSLQ